MPEALRAGRRAGSPPYCGEGLISAKSQCAAHVTAPVADRCDVRLRPEVHETLSLKLLEEVSAFSRRRGFAVRQQLPAELSMAGSI